MIACLLMAGGAGGDADTDGDGLSDFQEVHKYFTDPDRPDSDGDGVPDGDRDERREFTYSLRTVLKIMPPITESALSDDYQDGWVRDRGDDYVELEIVHYPLNTVAESIRANPGWREVAASMTDHLAPGPTTNWDDAMRRDLLRELAADGIEVETLSERRVIERVSRWLLGRVEYLNSSAYAIRFRDGRPQLLPGFEDSFKAIMWNPQGTVEEQFEHELYGRGMYYGRTTGSCTSAANYLTTCLRAVGVPTRMVRAVPVVDASDPRQHELARRGITHARVRRAVLAALDRLGSSFAAHTYNEVYVGGRWHRLNYDRLGQNILDEGVMGLMTHVHVYNDLAEAGIADTWGVWVASGSREEPFLHSNPYHTVELSDLFGEHMD